MQTTVGRGTSGYIAHKGGESFPEVSGAGQRGTPAGAGGRGGRKEATHRHVVVLPGFVRRSHVRQVLDYFFGVLCLAGARFPSVNETRHGG